MSDAPNPDTIRSLLERIRWRTDKYRFDTGDPSAEDYRDAVAALALLDNADRYGGIYNRRAFEARCRLVPDPESAP